jgi:hypothetical protein
MVWLQRGHGASPSRRYRKRDEIKMEAYVEEFERLCHARMVSEVSSLWSVVDIKELTNQATTRNQN